MKTKISTSQAKRIAKKLSVNLDVINIEIWKKGLNIELEHGKINKKTNVSNDNLEITGKIALAHIMEFPNYYEYLIKMEHKLDKYWKGKKMPKVIS